MLIHYILLGVTPEASDEEIRTRYLEQVKRHTPEKDPVRFQEITAAYEAIKSIRKRLASRYLPPGKAIDVETELFALARAVSRKRRRVGLKELIRESGHKAASGTGV
ncbi:MAG: DnaJ domain-containing protein [Deltaproteobacteria bacterium]|nr:DnaJ domain-containing protein [Deltaproteobacteria bacterium]